MQSRSMSVLLAAALTALWAGSAIGQELALGYLPAGAGPFATFSKTNEIAAQIAIDEINAAGGIAGKRLRIVAFATAGKPDQAVVGVRTLADDDKGWAIGAPCAIAMVLAAVLLIGLHIEPKGSLAQWSQSLGHSVWPHVWHWLRSPGR